MDSFAAGRLRSLVVSCLVGFLVLGIFAPATVLVTPSTAQAQEEKGEEAAPDQPKANKKPNIAKHFVGSMFHDLIAAIVSSLIILISIAMVSLVIIVLLDVRMGECVPPALVEEFTELVNKRQMKQAYDLCRADRSFLAQVMTSGMLRLQYGIEDAREAMAATAEAVKSSKDSIISYFGVIGTLGPMLGLVGTVSGMIGAFLELATSEGAPKPAELAGEISTALVLTLLGVGIALPAIFFFSFFKNRLTIISVATSNQADDLLTQLYHNTKKAAGGAPERPATSAAVQQKG